MGNKVLIVDDEELILEVIKDGLELGGYESCTASNGDEGLRRLDEYKPDLIITDARMPGMDGYEFSRLVRQACDVPIIMLSGAGRLSDDTGAANVVDGFIRKPVQIGDLLAQVDSIMNRSVSAD